MGQECTISAYRRVRIGEQCVIADRAMFIDFDHGVVEVERPIRVQGIYTRECVIGSNVWVGYGACFLRGVQVGDNAIVGTNSVVTRDVHGERGGRRRAGEGDPNARGAAGNELARPGRAREPAPEKRLICIYSLFGHGAQARFEDETQGKETERHEADSQGV